MGFSQLSDESCAMNMMFHRSVKDVIIFARLLVGFHHHHVAVTVEVGHCWPLD